MEQTLLELRNITKSFPGVLALDKVQLEIRPGEVHVLMGENGAGKSTLMKIVDGIYRPDDGEIFVRGQQTNIHSPIEAMELGIAMIHQELNTVLHMTIAENIFLGREMGKGILYEKKEMALQAKKVLEQLEIDLNPNQKVIELSVAQRQMVEIAKAVSKNAQIIIMDEPTSAISDKEVEALFAIIKRFRKEGKGIIYISHKMDEIFRIADRITVMRDGKTVGTYNAQDITSEQLVAKMVGRELKEVYPRQISYEMGEEILNVKNLSSTDAFENVAFQLKKGEILGISGLMGAGRSEVAEAIFGLREKSGEIIVNGKKTVIHKPKDAIKAGIAFITEDRARTGLNLKTTVKKDVSTLTLSQYCNRLAIINKGKENQVVEASINKLRIKTPSSNQSVKNLSGGNQQKVIIARWLLADPDILIMDEPTRGIDVGAKFEIYTIMRELAASGKAILMISSELPEIIGMCDRTIVMHEGRVTGELSKEEMTQENIMKLASGL